MENCIFCKIIKGEIPSYKIYEDGSCKFGSFRGNKVSAQECKYTLNGHKITFKFEDGISRTYEWNIKCKISFEDEIKLVNYLSLILDALSLFI